MFTVINKNDMTAAALCQAYDSVGMFTDKLPHGQKNISTIKKVVSLTTNSKSVKASGQMLDSLLSIKENLTTDNVNVAIIQGQLKNTNDNLGKINSFLELIAVLFDNNAEVEVDDDNMIYFMANLQKAKGVMEYISDYLQLVLKVHSAKQDLHQASEYSLDALLALLKAA